MRSPFGAEWKERRGATVFSPRHQHRAARALAVAALVVASATAARASDPFTLSTPGASGIGAFDFQLATWGARSAFRGSPLYVGLSSALTAGTSQSIDLAVNAPAGFSVSLLEAFRRPNGDPFGYGSTWQMTVRIDSTAAALGSHVIRVTGTAGGVSRSVDLPVTVRAPAASPPAPLYPALSALPQLPAWEANMRSYGGAHCDRATILANSTWEGSVWYYDGERVYYQIADYTRDPSWAACARYVEEMYRDTYVLPNNGALPGWRLFTRGMTLDYQKTGDEASRTGAIAISLNAAFAAPNSFLPYAISAYSSREIAYSILSYLDAEELGSDRHPRLDEYVEIALGHLDQWFGSRTLDYVQPFMVGLTSEALIRYFRASGDPRVLPSLRMAAEWLWTHAWVSADQAFWYESYPYGGTFSGTYPTQGSPDLNLLIAPLYGWLYQQTGDPVWIARGDQVFAGGVLGAWLGGGKQFSQNYRWSFDYLRYRGSQTRAGGSFYTVAPCRMIDTRDGTGMLGAGPIRGGPLRSFQTAGRCGIPPEVRAIAANVTVVGPTAGGHAVVYPLGIPSPLASTINFRARQTRANSAVLALGEDGALAARSLPPTGTVHLVIDVTGYFR